MITVSDIIQELEELAPPDMAEEGDRIGLQTGSVTRVIHKICVSVDTSELEIDMAIKQKADMLIAHHPLIYKPITSMAETNPLTQRIIRAIKAGLAVYVMHTNYDTVPGGINDALAEKLGVFCVCPLHSIMQDKYYKIVVFVPEEAVERLRNVMAETGAGRIGQYTHCSFRSMGTGSFVPLPAATPYIGTSGKLEEVDEYRLEMIVQGAMLGYVLDVMLENHPYNEVAYDIYELENEPVNYGIGRVGILEKETTLAEFAQKVTSALEVRFPKVIGDPQKKIKRVALCGGSGSKLFQEAASANADVLVTGDTTHHNILDAQSLGLAMIDAGHFETEKPGMVKLVDRLKKTFDGSGIEIKYIENAE